MADIMISTTNLTKVYNGKVTVDNVSLQIERGGIIGLVGQNGAGKTTLIRMLTGLVNPTSGSFKILPDCKRLPTDVAAIVEKPSIYSSMSALDNLTAQSILLGLKTDTEYLSATLKLVGLDPTLKRPVKNYSLGMKQRLAIAMTLVGKPQLLILDEPTNGLDVLTAKVVTDFLEELKSEGKTIILSTHIFSLVEKLCDRVGIIIDGRLVALDTLQNITKECNLETAFFDLYYKVTGETL